MSNSSHGIRGITEACMSLKPVTLRATWFRDFDLRGNYSENSATAARGESVTSSQQGACASASSLVVGAVMFEVSEEPLVKGQFATYR